MNVVRLSALGRARFFRRWGHPRTIQRPEGLCQGNITVTALGIKPETFRFVPQLTAPHPIHIIWMEVKWSRYRPGVAQRAQTAALEGGEWSAARPGRTFTPGKTRYTILQEAGWAPGSVWTGIIWMYRSKFQVFTLWNKVRCFTAADVKIQNIHQFLGKAVPTLQTCSIFLVLWFVSK